MPPHEADPLTSLIENNVPASKPSLDFVSVSKMSGDYGIVTVAASQLMEDHNIVLLMGTHDSQENLCYMIDLCPLYCMVNH